MKIKITLIGLLVLIFMCFTYGNTDKAFADEEDRLEIEVDAGLDGKAKEDERYPVLLTITNNKEDFNGDLVLALPVANKVLPIDIASGSTKTLSFTLPSMQNMRNYQPNPNPNQNEPQFRLYEGDWEDGEEVNIDTSLDITPTYIQPDKLVIGVLSDQPDRLNYLKLTSFFGNSPEVINIEEDMIPKETGGLDVLDFLVINDYSVAKWSEQKQASIKAWVQGGGTLITGSEPGLEQQFGVLADMLPLTITGQENVPGINTLYQETLQADNIELFTGDIDKEATVLHKENSIPLVIESQYGKGTVTQVTFDLGLSALADWEGNVPLWQSFGKNTNTANASMPGMGMPTVNQLAEISNIFPTMANFKISTLAILFIAYLLIILPILYMILKRMDKREWAWIVIPALAIISSIGLYTVGAKDRLGTIKTNTVSVISVDEQGLGSGEGAVSMLSKASGSYSLSIHEEFDPFPTQDLYSQPNPYSDNPFVETEGNNTNVHFQGVEFWSPRSITIEHPSKEYGSFTSTLTLANGTISGQITSDFEFDFQKVYLISGQNYQEIGEISAGESKEISFNAQNRNYFQRPNEQVAYQLFGRSGQMGNQNAEQLNAELLSMAIRNKMDSSTNTPMLIGFTDASLYPVMINEEKTVQNNQHLFMQSTTIQLAEGEENLVSTELSLPAVSIENGQIHHNGVVTGESFIDTSGGSYLLTYELPVTVREQPFSLDELAIRLQQHRNDLSFSLYNAQRDEYDSIDQNQASFTEKADEKYLQNNAITLRVSSTGDGTIELPVVTIEGVISP